MRPIERLIRDNRSLPDEFELAPFDQLAVDRLAKRRRRRRWARDSERYDDPKYVTLAVDHDNQHLDKVTEQWRIAALSDDGPQDHRLSQVATTTAIREISLDARRVEYGRCSERGCPIPACYEVIGYFGPDLYCRSHLNQLRMWSSEQVDREHPLLFCESADGTRQLDGQRIGRLPQPQFFGLRVQPAKLITFGQLILSGSSVSRAARDANLSTISARTFIERAALPIPHRQRLIARAVQREVNQREAEQQRLQRRLAIETRQREAEQRKASARAARKEQRARELEEGMMLFNANEQRRQIEVAARWRERSLANRPNTKWGFIVDAVANADRVVIKHPDSKLARARISHMLGSFRETQDFKWSCRDLGGAVQITRIARRTAFELYESERDAT